MLKSRTITGRIAMNVRLKNILLFTTILVSLLVSALSPAGAVMKVAPDDTDQGSRDAPALREGLTLSESETLGSGNTYSFIHLGPNVKLSIKGASISLDGEDAGFFTADSGATLEISNGGSLNVKGGYFRFYGESITITDGSSLSVTNGTQTDGKGGKSQIKANQMSGALSVMGSSTLSVVGGAGEDGGDSAGSNGGIGKFSVNAEGDIDITDGSSITVKGGAGGNSQGSVGGTGGQAEFSLTTESGSMSIQDSSLKVEGGPGGMSSGSKGGNGGEMILAELTATSIIIDESDIACRGGDPGAGGDPGFDNWLTLEGSNQIGVDAGQMAVFSDAQTEFDVGLLKVKSPGVTIVNPNINDYTKIEPIGSDTAGGIYFWLRVILQEDGTAKSLDGTVSFFTPTSYGSLQDRIPDDQESNDGQVLINLPGIWFSTQNKINVQYRISADVFGVTAMEENIRVVGYTEVEINITMLDLSIELPKPEDVLFGVVTLEANIIVESEYENDITKVEARVDDGSVVAMLPTDFPFEYKAQWDTKNTSDGRHHITFFAQDEEGFKAERKVVVTVNQALRPDPPEVVSSSLKFGTKQIMPNKQTMVEIKNEPGSISDLKMTGLVMDEDFGNDWDKGTEVVYVKVHLQRDNGDGTYTQLHVEDANLITGVGNKEKEFEATIDLAAVVAIEGMVTVWIEVFDGAVPSEWDPDNTYQLEVVKINLPQMQVGILDKDNKELSIVKGKPGTYKLESDVGETAVSVILDGSDSSIEEGTITGYYWLLDDGTPINEPDQAKVTHIFREPNGDEYSDYTMSVGVTFNFSYTQKGKDYVSPTYNYTFNVSFVGKEEPATGPLSGMGLTMTNTVPIMTIILIILIVVGVAVIFSISKKESVELKKQLDVIDFQTQVKIDHSQSQMGESEILAERKLIEQRTNQPGFYGGHQYNYIPGQPVAPQGTHPAPLQGSHPGKPAAQTPVAGRPVQGRPPQ